MHPVPAGILWLLLAATGTPVAADPTPTEGVTAEVSASPELRRPILGPLRRSLETLRASLSAPGTACHDADGQPGAASDEADRRTGTRPSISCLAAAQVSPGPPTAPGRPTVPSQYRFLAYLLGSLALALIVWLISLL